MQHKHCIEISVCELNEWCRTGFFLYLLEILRGSLKFETVQGNITTTTAILRLSTINIVFDCYRGCRQARRTKIGKGGGNPK